MAFNQQEVYDRARKAAGIAYLWVCCDSHMYTGLKINPKDTAEITEYINAYGYVEQTDTRLGQLYFELTANNTGSKGDRMHKAAIQAVLADRARERRAQYQAQQ